MNIVIREKQLKGGNKSLYLDIYEDGERRYEFLKLYLIPEDAPNAKKLNEQTRQKALAIKSERMLGKEKEEKKSFVPIECLTVSEWLHRVTQEIEKQPCSSTYKRQMATVASIVSQYLAKKKKTTLPLQKVDGNFVRGFLDFLQTEYANPHFKKQKQYLSHASANAYQNKFCTLLNMAVRQGLIKSNPFFTLTEQERIGKPDTNREYLTKDEVIAMGNVKTGAEDIKRAFMFCCFTGLRKSDVSRLTWDDIVETDSGEAICMEMKKTKTYVSIPLSQKAKEWLPTFDGTQTNVPLFPLPSATAIREGINIMARKAGIDKHITFHSSRHTFATLSLTAGNDLTTVSKLMGHKKVATTQIYGEVIMEKRQQAVNLMNGLFD